MLGRGIFCLILIQPWSTMYSVILEPTLSSTMIWATVTHLFDWSTRDGLHSLPYVTERQLPVTLSPVNYRSFLAPPLLIHTEHCRPGTQHKSNGDALNQLANQFNPSDVQMLPLDSSSCFQHNQMEDKCLLNPLHVIILCLMVVTKC